MLVRVKRYTGVELELELTPAHHGYCRNCDSDQMFGRVAGDFGLPSEDRGRSRWMPELYCTRCGREEMLGPGLSLGEVERLVEETKARDAEERRTMDRDGVLRRLDSLVANVTRSVPTLSHKLTAEEEEGIQEAVENVRKARRDGSLDDLQARLQDIEKAATVIGQAMRRPDSTPT
jgi:hypothetical protein